MAVWDLFVDESYNSTVFCVGGFFGPPPAWQEVISKWSAVIAAENSNSASEGFPPISRYHATDCTNLKREFATKNGWTVDRQVQLSKSLCEILGGVPLCGIVVGGRIADVQKYISPDTEKAKANLYELCFSMMMLDVEQLVRALFPDTTIRITFDDSENFGKCAKETFARMREDPAIAEVFTELVPANSRDAIGLQAADFFAYDGMKRLDGVRKGNEEIRKSLQAILNNIPLQIAQFTEQNCADLARIKENIDQGRPLDEGVESKLNISISGLQSLGVHVKNE